MRRMLLIIVGLVALAFVALMLMGALDIWSRSDIFRR